MRKPSVTSAPDFTAAKAGASRAQLDGKSVKLYLIDYRTMDTIDYKTMRLLEGVGE